MQAHLVEREASDTVRSGRAEQGAGSQSFVRGQALTGQARFTSLCSLLKPSRSISVPSRSLLNIQKVKLIIEMVCLTECLLRVHVRALFV